MVHQIRHGNLLEKVKIRAFFDSYFYSIPDVSQCLKNETLCIIIAERGGTTK